MMLKVLILDDEQIILDALYQYMVKNRSDEYEIFSADTVKGCLAILESKRIDILISDIEMPDKNGLYLHQQICKLYPSCRVVFFTAHAKFDYAYYANQYNTKLVLKSEGFDNLLLVVDQTALELKTELLYNSSSNNLCLRTPIRLDKLLKQKDFSIAQLKSQLNCQKSCLSWNKEAYFVLFRLPFVVQEKDDKIPKIMKMLSQHFEHYYAIEVFVISSSYILIAFQSKITSDLSRCMIHIDNLLELLHPTICEITNSNIQIVLSENFVQTNQILIQYETLHQTISQYQESSMELICKVNYQNHNEYKLLKCDRQLIVDLMQQNMTNMAKHIKCLLNLCLNQPNQEERLKSHLNFILSTYIEKNDEWENSSISKKIRKLFEASLEELNEKFVMDLFLSVISGNTTIIMEDQYDNTNNHIVLEIDQFIQNNYYKDISLSDIANHVYLSPTYISKIYKQEKGENIVNRIQQVRLYQSIYLLQNSNMKITDVASAVGFASPRYFITLFKKWKGITPKQFREEKNLS